MNKHKRIINIMSLLFVVIFLITAMTFNVSSEEPETKNVKKRYTVVVLDVAGETEFHFKSSWMHIYPGGSMVYTANSAIEEVKKAAGEFLNDLKYSIDDNYIAIVSYAGTATLVSDFTDDYSKLQTALNGVEKADFDDERDGDNIGAGLQMADELLSKINDENAIKNVLLCTTGLCDRGDYDYDGEYYNEETIGSSWQNMETEIRLYAYANCAVAQAQAVKNKDIEIYVIGIHQPIESALPSEGKDVAEFFRLTAGDIASSEDTYYIVEDTDELVFVFGELEDDITGTKMVRIYNDSTGYASTAPTEYPEGKLGGHYEEMLWGPSLFAVPATRMYLQSVTSPESANYNLAMACGNLCITSYNPDYLKQAYNDLGFEDENIFFYSYPDHELNRPDALRYGKEFAKDDDLAFSIATREIKVAGEKADLLVITLRGTKNFHEAVKDGTCVADKDFYGYMAWDWIYEFEEDVFAGLEDFYNEHNTLGDRPLKILVTGHSLGGAGANLVAAKLNKEVNSDRWFAKNTTVDDIYAYTFGAIDSISKSATNSDIFKEFVKTPIFNGFENIVNIYNYLDTFGPNSDGAYEVFTAAGNTMYDKFGLFYTFSNNMNSVVNQESNWKTHEISGYIHAIKVGWLESDIKTDKKRIWIRCPVDVQVYDGDKLVCSVEANEIVQQSDEIPVCVENEGKVLLLPDNKDYDIRITATDVGMMNYSVQSLNNEDESFIEYQDVSLGNGKMMLSEIKSGVSNDKIELFVIDSDGNKIAQISTDGGETLIKDKLSENKKGEKSYTSLIIALACFAVAFLLLTAVVVIVVIKKKRKQQNNYYQMPQ